MSTPKSRRLVLVTGGTGYVGSVLCPLLASYRPVRVFCSELFGNSIEGDHRIEFVKGDVRDDGALRDALKGVTGVVHLAGVVTDELVDMNPGLARQINVEATETLCKLAIEAGVERIVYASSSSVYGTCDQNATELTPPKPMSAYAQMKLEGEQIVLSNAPEIAVTALRSATCCGPAPRMRLDTIVNAFSKQAYFDGEITVHGGGQWRSNLHVIDAAHAYVAVLEAYPGLINGRPFNVTAGNHTAIVLAGMVADSSRAWGRPAKITVQDRHDSRNYRLSSAVIRNLLPWLPVNTIERAVVDNFDWFSKGGVSKPNDDIYYNTRRMTPVMKGEA